MNTIIEDRLNQLPDLTLDKGIHDDFAEGHCAMEVVAWLAGEGHTDAPECASKVLRSFTVSLNDTWNAEDRQRLVPFLPRMVGTGNDGMDEARSYLGLDWLIHTYTPAWLDLAGLSAEAQDLRDLRRIVGLVSAQAASPVIRAVRKKAAATPGAARAVVWDATGAAARHAAWNAAWNAAGAAVWETAGDADWGDAGAVVWDAAWAAAGAAAYDAAGVIGRARVALAPTVEALKTSALELLDAMIDPAAARCP